MKVAHSSWRDHRVPYAVQQLMVVRWCLAVAYRCLSVHMRVQIHRVGGMHRVECECCAVTSGSVTGLDHVLEVDIAGSAVWHWDVGLNWHLIVA